MCDSFNAVKTVKWRVVTKKLHYFAENITRPIEKYIKAAIYCVHNIKMEVCKMKVIMEQVKLPTRVG